MKQKTNQTPSRVNTVNRIDEIIIKAIMPYEHKYGNQQLDAQSHEVFVSNLGHTIDKAKDALYKEIMGCIGEDEKFPNFLGLAAAFGGTEVYKDYQQDEEKMEIRNQLRSEIRKSINDLFSLQDKGKE